MRCSLSHCYLLLSFARIGARPCSVLALESIISPQKMPMSFCLCLWARAIRINLIPPRWQGMSLISDCSSLQVIIIYELASLLALAMPGRASAKLQGKLTNNNLSQTIKGMQEEVICLWFINLYSHLSSFVKKISLNLAEVNVHRQNGGVENEIILWILMMEIGRGGGRNKVSNNAAAYNFNKYNRIKAQSLVSCYILQRMLPKHKRW